MLLDGECTYPSGDGRRGHCMECMRQPDCELLRLCEMRRFGKTLSDGISRDNLLMLLAMGVTDYNAEYGTTITEADLARIDEQIELDPGKSPSLIAQTMTAISQTWRG